MRLIGIGLAAALALGALAPAVYSADKAAGVDPKAKAQGMKEAPAVAQAIGLKCTVTDARFIGQNKDPKTKVAVSYYEVACQEGMGYVIGGPAAADAKPTIIDCLAASNPSADGKPSSIACKLPENSDPKQALAPLVAKGGKACVIEKARGIGESPSNAFFEVACQGGTGYILQASNPPDPAKDVLMSSCLEFGPDSKLACTLTDSSKALAASDALMGEAAKGCTVKDRRFVMTTRAGTEFYEFSCTDGKGWMVEKTTAGALGRVIDCASADNIISGGCTLTDARAAQTEQAGLYSRLAKKAGFDCDVEKYGPLTGATGEEVVELKCKNRPDGGIAVFKGAGGTVYDCAHSELVGYRCAFTHADAALGGLTADLKKLGKTTCDVSGTRSIGTTAEKHGYVEVACSDGNPGWVIDYALTPMTPTSVITCGQASGIGGGCKLPTNTKKK